MTVRPGPQFYPVFSFITWIALWILLSLSANAAAASVKDSSLKETPFAGLRFIAGTDAVRGGENFGHTLVLRASASEPPQPITVALPVPASTILVSASPELVLNEAEGKLAWQGMIAPGQYLSFMILLTAVPDNAGDRTIPVSATISWPGGTHRFHSEIKILANDIGGREAETKEGEISFDRSELAASTGMVREGEILMYTLTVRSDGSDTSQRILVTFRPPDPVMVAYSSPPMADDVEYPRQLTWEGDIGPGQELTFTITLVTLPESASNRSLRASAGISWRPADREWEVRSHWLQSEAEIRSKPAPILCVLPNGIGIGKVELIVLAYLGIGPLLIMLIPALIGRREKQRGLDKKSNKMVLFAMSVLFVCSLGVLHLIISIAWDDIRRFAAYEKTTCILLDKRIVLEESRSFSRGGGPRTLSTTTAYNKPLVAVHYPAGGREIITAGSPRPAAMLSPRGKYAFRELAQYERGHSYPCWYDPLAPTTFVLDRGFSLGWYLLGVGPMFLLYFLGRFFVHRLR